MSTTVQQAINAAIERSNLNDSTLIDSTEAIRFTSLYEQMAFKLAARENPNYFGKEGVTAVRSSYTDSWNIGTTPGNIAAVTRAEVSSITGTVSGISTGDPVDIIDIRHPEFGVSPRAYIRNQRLYPWNSELQTDASNFVTRLKLYYSYMPSLRTATSDTLELPDEHMQLIVLPLARLFALRDQRPDELPGIDAEYQLELQLFMDLVKVYDEGTVRAEGTTRASM